MGWYSFFLILPAFVVLSLRWVIAAFQLQDLSVLSPSLLFCFLVVSVMKIGASVSVLEIYIAVEEKFDELEDKLESGCCMWSSLSKSCAQMNLSRGYPMP